MTSLPCAVAVHTPPPDCDRCPRLAEFRQDNRQRQPAWHNAPVASFGDRQARLLIVGLAPGMGGANRTGRPFTGDHAGDLLYETLGRFGFARGRYDRRPDDGLCLLDCRITNAVRCVPPQNKPTGPEIKACRQYLLPEIMQPPRPAILLALGRIAHESILAALDLRRASYPFGHGAVHQLEAGLSLYDSYHCSRYNTNTRRLTAAMFDAVFQAVRDDLGPPAAAP